MINLRKYQSIIVGSIFGVGIGLYAWLPMMEQYKREGIFEQLMLQKSDKTNNNTKKDTPMKDVDADNPKLMMVQSSKGSGLDSNELRSE
ncbi:4978_t:CDS:2 [Cetraspora pellucida]|uniref:4978_t:CDS:1 n=1 Tax=Cetraspora pellucida TaxID=1433469 RepID=A0A9N8VWV4_9GLOM|nr:4978_t:CDS:2 [Cetraspora pellucida]